MSSSFAKQVQKEKDFISKLNGNKLPSIEKGQEYLKSAWQKLVTSQAMTLKDISICRSFVDCCISKWPALEKDLGNWMMNELVRAQSQQETRLFSKLLLASLDCESCKKSLKRVLLENPDKIPLLLHGLDSSISCLQSCLRAEVEISNDLFESFRDLERCFDCICRLLNLLKGVSLSDENIISLLNRIRLVITSFSPSKTTEIEVDVLRSASLALFQLNNSLQNPESLSSLIFSGSLSVSGRESSLPPLTRAALLLGAMSSHRHADSPKAFSDLLDAIEKCLEASFQKQQEDEGIEDDTFESHSLPWEALCAWTTKAKQSFSVTSVQVSRAIDIVTLYSDHRQSSVGSVCATAFERLIETCLKIENGDEILVKVFNTQIDHVSSLDFTAARRGLYPMLEKIISVLGAKRVLELKPNFVSIMMNSAFRENEISSNRPELGNGICNLIVRFFRSWLAETDFKVTQALRNELQWIANILKRGPDDLFASYFVCRRLLSDLLSEAKSPQETEAMKEIGRGFLHWLSFNNRGNNKRSFEESRIELFKDIFEQDYTSIFWAQLNVLLSLERGGIHISVIENVDDDGKKKKHQTRFEISSSSLFNALIHHSSSIREPAWALVSTRVKRSKFPETIVLSLVSKAFPLLLKLEGASLKPSMIRLFERIHFCLENGGAEDDEEDAKISSKGFIKKVCHQISLNIYQGAPFDRISLAIDLAVSLLHTFLKNSSKKAMFLDILEPLLRAGTIRCLIAVLESPFDAIRLQAFEFLRYIPGPLPGFETRASLDRLIQTWYPKLEAPMRREADSAALFFRLIHAKYCLELGWLVDLPNLSEPNSSLVEQTRLQSFLKREKDLYFMRLAIAESRKCIHTSTAFNVGCVIVKDGTVLSTGFSRELPGNTHAEECALRKLAPGYEEEEDSSNGKAIGATIYTTMEPCSKRLSQNRSCTSRCISAKVNRVVIGFKEPDKFVKCEGWQILEESGIQVEGIDDERLIQEISKISQNDPSTIVPEELDDGSKLTMFNLIHAQNLPRILVSAAFCEQNLNLIQSRSQTGNSIHGSLMMFRYLCKDVVEFEKSFSKRVIPIVLSTLNIGVQALIQVESETRGNNDHEQENDDNDEDFIMKTTGWLSVREGSELLGELLEKILRPRRKEEEPVDVDKEWWTVDEVKGWCSWFVKTALSLRHLGAMTYVTKAIERVCKLLFQSDQIEFQRTPLLEWVPDLLSKLGIESFNRALRRTEGFAFVFRAIIRAAQVTQRIDIIHTVLKQLLTLASSSTSPTPLLVDCLNVMSTLFEDSIPAKSLIPFVSSALELAVNGFRSPHWSVRNSSLNLFVSLVKRAVGEPEQGNGEVIPTKTHFTTARLFFKTHPRLYPFLFKELSDAVSSISLENHPSLHPVLLFLSSLRRSNNVADDPALSFVPLVQKVALEHPQYLMRSTAARALVILTPRSQAPILQLLQLLENQTNFNNQSHGVLMQLVHWLKLIKSEKVVEDHSALSTLLRDRFILNQQCPPILREVALECFEHIFDSKYYEGRDTFATLNQLVSSLEKINQSDGALIGMSRFRYRILKTSSKYAINNGNWELLISLLTQYGDTRYIFEELIRFFKKTDQVIHMTGYESSFLNVLLEGIEHQPKKTQYLECFAAFLSCSVSNVVLSSLSSDTFRLIFSISQKCNMKSRAACLEILSHAQSNEEDACLFVNNLEKDCTPESPLELRLASAYSLKNGCLEQITDTSLRSWICALSLLQDDDREVCEIARTAVRKAGNLPDCCLNLIFAQSWETVTKQYWRFPRWQETLVKWIFLDSENMAASSDSADAVVLYRADNPNEFIESSSFTKFACQEMIRLKRLQMFNEGSDRQEQEYRSLAIRARLNFERMLEMYQFEEYLSENSYHCFLSGLASLAAFADPLDWNVPKALKQYRQQFRSFAPTSLMEQEQLVYTQLGFQFEE